MNPETQIDQLHSRARDGHPESQFLLSQICLRDGDIDGMVVWLQRACANNLADAIGALGHCRETGLGFTQDFDQALSNYDRAIEAGSTLTAYRKAKMLFRSKSARENGTLVHNLLMMSARAGFVPALRATGFLAMQHTSSRPLALECFRRAARGGDPVSCFNLGWCLLKGWDGDNTNNESNWCLQQAAAADYPFVDTLLAQLSKSDPVQPDTVSNTAVDWSIPGPLLPETQSANEQCLSSDPAIRLFDNVLNMVDRAYLIYLSRPLMRRADVIDPDGRKEGKASEVRTNRSTYLPHPQVDIISRYVEWKIVCETGETLECSEPMSILHYAPGQYYRPHVDYFDPRLAVSAEHMVDGGQRTASAITYLAAPSAGGGTGFPRLDLQVPARAGSTLWFRNCTDDGVIDNRSVHSGEPVEQGDKWVVTKWFRENPTQYLPY